MKKADKRPVIDVMEYFIKLCQESSLDALIQWKKQAKEEIEQGKITRGKITDMFDEVLDLHIQALRENKSVTEVYAITKETLIGRRNIKAII